MLAAVGAFLIQKLYCFGRRGTPGYNMGTMPMGPGRGMPQPGMGLQGLAPPGMAPQGRGMPGVTHGMGMHGMAPQGMNIAPGMGMGMSMNMPGRGMNMTPPQASMGGYPNMGLNGQPAHPMGNGMGGMNVGMPGGMLPPHMQGQGDLLL